MTTDDRADDEADWEMAAQGLAAKFGNHVLHELTDSEMSVLFCGLVVQAVGRGMLMEEIHRAVDAAIAANAHLATGRGDA